MAVRMPPGPDVTGVTPIAVTRTIRAALALLTRLPVRPEADTATGAAAFPLVGVIVGIAGVVPLMLGATAEPVIASFVAVGAMALLTGALHLDGLADTADALLAPDPATAERARKDPAVGPGGAVALVLVIGIEVWALASIVASAGIATAGAALVVAAVVARTLPVVVAVMAGSRVGGGLGGWFVAHVGREDAVVAVTLATLVTVGLAFATRSVGIAVDGVIGAGVGLAIAGAIVRARRQLDGDGLGAIVELTMAVSLAAAAFAT
jgi:adenosylcobinamide-GDP ribazoletransferase